MYSQFGFKSVSDQLQSEISTYLQQHEPPLEHQITRILLNLSNEITCSNTHFDVSKVRVLFSSDTNKSRVVISLPCQNISQNLNDMIQQIMAKFNYKPLNKSYLSDLNELHLHYQI
jgi:hypothetical protein